MNVLFDASTLNNEFVGISKTLLFLYKSCHRLDPTFQALGFDYDGQDCFRFAHMGIVLMGRCTTLELDEIVRECHIDVLHFPANFSRLRKVKGVPHVVIVHDLTPYELNEFPSPLSRAKYHIKTQLTFRLADRIITPSEYSRTVIASYTHGAIDSEVIPWGVTLPNVAPKRVLPYPYFLYVGGYDTRKGIDVLVRAYNTLQGEGTDAKLVLAGKPRPLDDETDRLLHEGIMRGSIVQTGYVTDEELCNLYAGAICSLYLSKAEGFGLPIIEAMHYGCPAIASKSSCLPEIGSDAACCVDRDNVGEVTSAMLRMQHDEEYRRGHIEAGFKNITRFGWDRSARRFLNVLESVIHKDGCH